VLDSTGNARSQCSLFTSLAQTHAIADGQRLKTMNSGWTATKAKQQAPVSWLHSLKWTRQSTRWSTRASCSPGSSPPRWPLRSVRGTCSTMTARLLRPRSWSWRPPLRRTRATHTTPNKLERNAQHSRIRILTAYKTNLTRHERIRFTAALQASTHAHEHDARHTCNTRNVPWRAYS
jgi:hypothetical protein